MFEAEFRGQTAGGSVTPDSLKAWRERLGLNKTEASAALGLSINAYAAYERGHYNGARRPIPKYVALACAALALGVPPHS